MKRPTVKVVRPDKLEPRERYAITKMIWDHGQLTSMARLKDQMIYGHLLAYAVSSQNVPVASMMIKGYNDVYHNYVFDKLKLPRILCYERGYTTVKKLYRRMGLAQRMLYLLDKRMTKTGDGSYPLLVTIHEDNLPAIALTEKNGMIKMGTFCNRTGACKLVLYLNQAGKDLIDEKRNEGNIEETPKV